MSPNNVSESKFKCSECYGDLEVQVYAGLGTYVEPCQRCKENYGESVCANTVERVAYQSVSDLEDEIESFLDNLELDTTSDNSEKLKNTLDFLNKNCELCALAIIDDAYDFWEEIKDDC